MPDRSHHAEHHKYGAERQPPLWERVVAAISLMLVAGLLGYLLYEVLAGDHSPPDIVVEIVEIRENGNDWLVLFQAWNHGGTTASGVAIEGQLSRFGITVESAQVTLDFIPAKSSRRGGLYFQNDPSDRDLELQTSGYVLP